MILIGEGEPLLHPDIAGMAAAAKQAGCRVTLLTNGTILGPDRAREFAEAGLDELRVSLRAPEDSVPAYALPMTMPRATSRRCRSILRQGIVRTQRISPSSSR